MSHTYCSLTFHIIFSTKSRTTFLSDKAPPHIYGCLKSVIDNEFGHTRIVNGELVHIHIPADIQAKPSISHAIGHVNHRRSCGLC